MPMPSPGLHHVTAISGPPQRNLDFYAGPFGQRLVKQTVNFDDPGIYHLYYGDGNGTPGSILTFFPFEAARKGHAGAGMASALAYRVSPEGLSILRDTLARRGTEIEAARPRFDAPVHVMRDPDGLVIELITQEDIAGDRPEGFHSVTLSLTDPAPTARLLIDILGYREIGEQREPGGMRLRLGAPGNAPGRHVDLWRDDQPGRAKPGAGTIHHVAFRAHDDAHQAELRAVLMDAGMQVTDPIDRQYFNAIYFREPGGVLFEIATDPPGFTADESPDSLGQALKLPPRYESRRAAIEARLPALQVPE